MGCEAVNFWDICEHFFWPQNSCQSQLSSAQKITKPKKNRCRLKSKVRPKDLTKKNVCGEDHDQRQSQAQVIPIDAHSVPPIKISRSRVKVADSDTSDDNVSLDDCLSLNYQAVHGVPGFEVETADDAFWVQIAH